MGHDRDIMILAWLKRQPSGFGLLKDFPSASLEDLKSLEIRGLISRMRSNEPNGEDGFVITPEGKDYQEGD